MHSLSLRASLGESYLGAAQSIHFALTLEQQADLLLARGIVANGDDLLRTVSYYHPSGYSPPFRRPDGLFRQGTTLQTICRRYTFDCRLRSPVLNAIERVEVCLRAEVVRQPRKHRDRSAIASRPSRSFSREYGSATRNRSSDGGTRRARPGSGHLLRHCRSKCARSDNGDVGLQRRAKVADESRETVRSNRVKRRRAASFRSCRAGTGARGW